MRQTKNKTKLSSVLFATLLVIILVLSFGCGQTAPSPTPSSPSPTLSPKPSPTASPTSPPATSPTPSPTTSPTSSPKPTVSPSQQPLTFTQIVSLSGPLAPYFASEVAGANDAIKYVNEELGGVDGHPLKTEVFDGAYDLKQMGTIYENLRTRANKPSLLIVHQTAFETAYLSRFQEDQIPVLGTGASVSTYPKGWTPGSTQSPGWKFSDVSPYEGWSGGMMKFIADDWKKNPLHTGNPRLAFLSWDSEAAHVFDNVECSAYAKSLGIDIVAREYFPTSAMTVMEPLMRIKQAQADWVFSWTTLPTVAVVLKEMASLDMVPPKVRYFGIEGGMDKMVYMQAKEASAKILPYKVASGPSYDETGNKFVDTVNKYFKAGGYTDDLRSYGYIRCFNMVGYIYEIFKRALKEVGYEKLSGPAIYNVLNNLEFTDWSGVKVNFKGNNRTTNQVAIHRMTSDGRLIPETGWFQAPDLRFHGADVPAGTYK